MGLVPADYRSMGRSEAEEFDKRVVKNFARAFPAVARQVMETCNILKGICVEIGSGTCRLTVELARQSELEIYALEKAPAMFERGKKNIEKTGLSGRVTTILGDAHEMPFEDNFADLIVSRGSYHYWTDKVVVFKEIMRVLKPSGKAFIGGGFGSGHSEAELEKMVKLRDQSLGDASDHYYSSKKMKETLQGAGITKYKILLDETGMWAVI
jgi:ubiquinone/menaquinone biosynthesis C-methylase UbiE